MILVWVGLFLCSYTSAQFNPDSLQFAVDSLNKMMVSEIQGFENSNSDFLVLLVNDPSSDWYNSYHCIHQLDSCSVSCYVIMIDIHLTDESLQTYEVRLPKIFKSRRVPPGKKACYNELEEIKKYLEKGYLIKSRKQDPSNWQKHSYMLYGKVGGDYIFETFDPDFIATFHSGMVYEIVCDKFGQPCPE